jgi:hypothetical protein
MKKLIRLFFMIPIFSLFVCGKDVNGPNPGPPPKLWPTPSETAVVERGIDAIPDADAIQLDWTIENDKDVEQFLLYRRSEDEEKFSLLRTLDRKDSTWVDGNNIKLHTRYYYYICSVDGNNRQGSPSDTVDYRLIEKAHNLSATLEAKPLFRWQIQDYNFQEYVIKIIHTNTGEKVWFAIVGTDFTDLDDKVRYNFDGQAKYESLKSDQQYQWRVDIIGPAKNSGSESRWQPFSPP